MKKSDNFLSDFLFFVGVVAQVEIWEGCEEWEGCEGCDGWGRYELQTCVGGVVVALNYS